MSYWAPYAPVMPRRPRWLPLAVSCSLVTICLVGAWLAPSAAAATGVARAGGPASASHQASERPIAAAAAQAGGGSVAGVGRAPDGAGLARVCVVATGQSASVPGMTGPGGRYLITGLRPGAYSIGYHDCGTSGRYLDQFYGGSMLPDAAARVPVSARPPTFLRPGALVPGGGAAPHNTGQAPAPPPPPVRGDS